MTEETTQEQSEVKDQKKKKSPFPEVLKDPALLYQVKRECLDEDIVGEDHNKLLLFIICSSCFTDFPIGAIITGESSSGKSHLAESVLRHLPKSVQKSFSRMTAAAPDRSGFQFTNSILFISELYGLEEAQAKIRVLISEGNLRLLTTSVEGGVEVIETEGIPVFITTTTNVSPDNELLNRLFILSLDETMKQTRKIVEYEAQEFMIFEGLLKPPSKFLDAWEHIANTPETHYKIPFADLLAKAFPVASLKARRDFKKLLWIIGTIAVLHQYQRPIVCRTDQKGEMIKAPRWVLATPADFFMAWRVCGPSLQATLLNIQARSIDALKVFEANPNVEMTTTEISRLIKRSQSRAREILNNLVSQGYITVKREKRPYKYKLMRTMDDYSCSIMNFETILRVFDRKKLWEFITDKKLNAVSREKRDVYDHFIPLTIEEIPFPDEVVDPLTGSWMKLDMITLEALSALDTAFSKIEEKKPEKPKKKTFKLGSSELPVEDQKEVAKKTTMDPSLQEIIEAMKKELTAEEFTYNEALSACKKTGTTQMKCSALFASMLYDGVVQELPISRGQEKLFGWVRRS